MNWMNQVNWTNRMKMRREKINLDREKARVIWPAFLLLVLIGAWAAPAFPQIASPASALTLHEVQLTGDGQDKRVAIQLSRSPTSIKFFSLTSPPRIVIDVRGPTRGLPSATYRAQDELIKRVRVGYHKRYIRFVLDLKGNAIPNFSAKQHATGVTVLLASVGKISEQAAVQILFSHTGKRGIQRPRPIVAKKTTPAPPARPKAVAQSPPRLAKKMPRPNRSQVTALRGVLLPEIAPPRDARQVGMRPAKQPGPIEQPERAGRPEPARQPQTPLAIKPQAAPPQPAKATTPLEFPGTSFPPERRPSAPSSPSAQTRAEGRRSPLLDWPVSRTPKTVSPSSSQYSLLTQSNKTPSTRPAPPQYSLLDSSGRSQATPPPSPLEAPVERPQMAALLPQSRAKSPARTPASKPVVTTSSLSSQAGGETPLEAPAERPQMAALLPQSRAKSPARTPALPPVVTTPGPSAEKSRSPNSLSREARRHLGKGQILYDQGSVDEAIVEWRQTARLAPDNAKVHHLLGLALQDRGDQKEAITELNTSLRLDPENATAYVHLAQALEAQGDVQAARTAYTKAVKLVPTSAHVHNRLGHLLAAQEDWKGAAKEWRQTTELQPDYAYAYANLGEALERIEKKKEALEAYRQAVSLDPSAPFVAEVNQRIIRLNAYDL